MFAHCLRAADELFARGKEGEAEEAYRALLADMEAANGSEHPSLSGFWRSLPGSYGIRCETMRPGSLQIEPSV